MLEMKEKGIGFLKDVGGRDLMKNMNDNLGYYIELKGKRIRWGDWMKRGIEKNEVEERDMEDVREDIIENGDIEEEIKRRK